MMWLDQLNLQSFGLLPGATAEIVSSVEEQLGVVLPGDYRDFLEMFDGGIIGNFIFLSAGKGIHSEETLLRANQDADAEFPLTCIGHEASDDFGFKKSEVEMTDPPVYVISHETWELQSAAKSFRDFLVRIAKLKPGDTFRP